MKKWSEVLDKNSLISLSILVTTILLLSFLGKKQFVPQFQEDGQNYIRIFANKDNFKVKPKTTDPSDAIERMPRPGLNPEQRLSGKLKAVEIDGKDYPVVERVIKYYKFKDNGSIYIFSGKLELEGSQTQTDKYYTYVLIQDDTQIPLTLK